MQLITVIMNAFKLDEVRVATAELGVEGMTVTEVKGFGRQRGHTEQYRGAEYEVKFVPKIRLDIVARDETAEQIIETIVNTARTGKIGDGKVFVSELKQVIRVRTGETGAAAL